MQGVLPASCIPNPNLNRVSPHGICHICTSDYTLFLSYPHILLKHQGRFPEKYNVVREHVLNEQVNEENYRGKLQCNKGKRKVSDYQAIPCLCISEEVHDA